MPTFTNPFAPDPEYQPPTVGLSPLQLQQMMDTLPAIQKQKRRAETLRARQQRFHDLANTPVEAGSMLPTQHGGLYETVSRYNPNWGGILAQGAGALSEYLTGKQADRAQANYEAMTNPEILKAAQQLGGTNRTAQSLAQTLGTAAPEDTSKPMVVNIEGATPQQNAEIQQTANAMRAAGKPTEEIDAYVAQKQDEITNPPQPGQNRGPMDITSIAPDNTQAPNGPAAAPNPSQATTAALSAAAGLPPPDINLQQPQTPPMAPGQVAQSTPMQGVDQAPAMPQPLDQAPLPVPVGASTQAAAPISASGVVPAQPSPPAAGAMPAPGAPNALSQNPTDSALRAYLGLMGVDAKNLIGDPTKTHWVNSYIDNQTGERVDVMSDNTHQRSGMFPQGKVEPYNIPGQKAGMIFTSGPFQGRFATTDFSGGSPNLVPGDYAPGYGPGGQTGQGASGSPGAPPTGPITQNIPTEGQKKEETDTAEQRVAAKAALPALRAQTIKSLGHINDLRNNMEGLRGISGNTAAGRLSAVPWIGNELASGYTGMFKPGTPEANATAAIDVLTSDAFIESYKDALKGTGSISNVEGLRGAARNLQLARYQSPEVIKQRLDEYEDELRKLDARAESMANFGNPAPQQAPKVNVPSGWSIK